MTYPFGDPSVQYMFDSTRPVAEESRRAHSANDRELFREGIGMIPGVGFMSHLMTPLIDDYRMAQFANNGFERSEASGPYAEYSPSRSLTTQQKGRRKQDDYFPEMDGNTYNPVLYKGQEFWEQQGDKARGKQNNPSYKSSWELPDEAGALEQAYYQMMKDKRSDDGHYMLGSGLWSLASLLPLLL